MSRSNAPARRAIRASPTLTGTSTNTRSRSSRPSGRSAASGVPTSPVCHARGKSASRCSPRRCRGSRAATSSSSWVARSATGSGGTSRADDDCPHPRPLPASGERAGVRGFRLWEPTVLALLLIGPAAADETALDALVHAYPQQLAGYDATYLIWRDGTRMPLSDGQPHKTFEEMLRHGSILDQISLSYPAGASLAVFARQSDPGRVRNRTFFDKMYGDCWRGEVAPRLVPVVWLPRSWGRTIRITSVNGVAERLAAVSEELDDLPDAVKRYAYPPAGTYNCRTVADTGEPSMHSWGAAIDINSAHADYWLWHRSGVIDAGLVNRIPPEIVAIFERHGFIWGGKWSHYDTMHFEYRPELLDGDQPRESVSFEPTARR